MGLFDDKGQHVVTQAAWAIQVAREALRRISVDPTSGDRLGSRIQRIYTLARSTVGKRLLAERGIELLDAIDVESLGAASPAHEKQLAAVREARQARRTA